MVFKGPKEEGIGEIANANISDMVSSVVEYGWSYGDRYRSACDVRKELNVQVGAREVKNRQELPSRDVMHF